MLTVVIIVLLWFVLLPVSCYYVLLLRVFVAVPHLCIVVVGSISLCCSLVHVFDCVCT